MITRDQIAQNYQAFLEKLEKAASRSGRRAGEVRLVLVTKMHPVETIHAALDLGIRCLGENYVEEAVEKIQTFPPALGIEWHMIGHLQSRKAESVVQHFHYLHSLDSLKLAARLERFAGAARLRLPVLLECNTSGEQNKSGYPAWQAEQWPVLADEIGQIAALPHLEVRGLMTMAPFSEEAEKARPYFRRLCELRDYLQQRLPEVKLSELSMGMSGDYEVAVEEGATWVRIGQGILGPRASVTNEAKGV